MELHAVFVRGEAEPAAVFSDADQAQRWRREHHGDNAVVVPVEASISKSALSDAADTAAAAFPGAAPAGEPEPGSTTDPDAALRGEIRTRLEEEERRERIEREVKAEMAADKRTEPASPSGATPRAGSPQARRA